MHKSYFFQVLSSESTMTKNRAHHHMYSRFEQKRDLVASTPRRMISQRRTEAFKFQIDNESA